MKKLDYKGYTGSIEYSKEDDLLAMSENKSLNNFVAESIRERIIKETGNQV